MLVADDKLSSLLDGSIPGINSTQVIRGLKLVLTFCNIKLNDFINRLVDGNSALSSWNPDASFNFLFSRWRANHMVCYPSTRARKVNGLH